MDSQDADFIGWIIGVLIFLSILGSIAAAIGSRGDDDGHGFFARLSGRYVFSDATPIGTKVRTIGETLVWSVADAGDLIGTHVKGATGRISDGPVLVQGERWWRVDFEDDPDGWVEQSSLKLVNVISTTATILKRISYALTFLLLVGIVYSLFRLNHVRAQENEALRIPDDDVFKTEDGAVQNERWEQVENLANSESPNDWRIAILEADSMLEDLVGRMQYDGESLGEQLKQIEKADFLTLDSAWEAHKVRNRIAHDGSDFILTQRELRRVISLYEEVFKEFEVI